MLATNVVFSQSSLALALQIVLARKSWEFFLKKCKMFLKNSSINVIGGEFDMSAVALNVFLSQAFGKEGGGTSRCRMQTEAHHVQGRRQLSSWRFWTFAARNGRTLPPVWAGIQWGGPEAQRAAVSRDEDPEPTWAGVNWLCQCRYIIESLCCSEY